MGSTKFNELVELVLKDAIIEQLLRWKTRKVLVQMGNCSVAEKGSFVKNGIQFEVYDYKPFLNEDMNWADLIISHAGAGTTMEALDLGKPLIVVPNRNLMDDHQLELAGKLAEGNHAVLTSIQTFNQDVKNVKKSWFQPPPQKKTRDFTEFLNKAVLGDDYKEKFNIK